MKYGKKLSASLKKHWRILVLALVYSVLLFFMFYFAAQAQYNSEQLSLRYTDNPVSGATAAEIKSKLAAPDYVPEYSVTFWKQTAQLQLSTDYGSATTGAVFGDGDLYGVYPATFIYGTYPSTIDTAGIAVSEGLAWQLWGGGDIVGTEFTWQGTTYIIRGVFKGTRPMALFQIDSSRNKTLEYTGVNLLGTSEGDPRTSAQNFVGELGLGTPNQIISGSSFVVVLQMLALLPITFVALWLVAHLLLQLKKLEFWPRQIVLFLFILALAILLPKLLGLLPAWVVPNKWSDLDSWSAFNQELYTRLTEWLSVYPSFYDVSIKLVIIRQVLLAVPALFVSTAAIRTWHRYAANAAPTVGLNQNAQPVQENTATGEYTAHKPETML